MYFRGQEINPMRIQMSATRVKFLRVHCSGTSWDLYFKVKDK